MWACRRHLRGMSSPPVNFNSNFAMTIKRMFDLSFHQYCQKLEGIYCQAVGLRNIMDMYIFDGVKCMNPKYVQS